MNLHGFDRPVFISRILHNEFKYVNLFPNFDGIIMDANLAQSYYNVWNNILEKRNKGNVKFLMVDPNTAKLEHRVCIQKKTYKDLNYCPEDEPFVAEDFINNDFAKEFATNVLNTQDTLEADILLTPYFIAKTILSPWYDVNLKLCRESLEIKKEFQYKQPIYATLCMNIIELTNEQHRKAIVQDYKNLRVDGYYILAEGLSDRNSSSLELGGLLLLIKELSEAKKPIFIGYIDGFGLFTTAFGSSGFSSGICWLETFDEQNFHLNLEGRNEDAMRERFIYIPETFMKFPRDRAQLIYQNNNIQGLTSTLNSKYYSNRTYAWPDRARLFFLEKRFEELEELKSLTVDEKLKTLKENLDNAIDITRQIYNEDIQIRPAHLQRWKNAIDGETI